MRPGYCPFCMAEEKLPAPERLESWTRDHQLWGHVEEHLEICHWPRRCPHPLCGASVFEDAAAFRFHLVDEHRFSQTRPVKAAYSTPPNGQPNKNLLDGGSPAVSSSPKRKQPTSTEALQWVPWQTTHHSRMIPEEAVFSRSPKRCRQSPPAICPAALSLERDLAVDHTAYGAKHSPMLSDPYFSGTESDETLMKYAYNITTPRCASPDSTGWAPALEGDGDILFSQYCRSPSPSPAPSPDDTSSESSGTTLVDFQSRQPCGSPGLSSATAASVVHDDEVPDHVRTLPRIRLRVSQPKITLRLNVSRTSHAPGNKGNVTKHRGNQRSREDSGSAKPKGIIISKKVKGKKRGGRR